MTTGLTVRAPATVANLGPGFDTLAFALDWYNEIRIESASSLTVTIEGEGEADLERGSGNLVVRAISSLLGAEPRVRVHLANRIPLGRGFGSSASAIVAGLIGARALGGRGDGEEVLLAEAVRIEGHADNVSACLYGGITVSLDGTPTGRLEPPEGIVPVVAVAPVGLSTVAAREALPDRVPFRDAVVTAGRAARLVAALASGETEALLAATDDVIHQPARFGLSPDSGTLVAALRAEGFAAFLSGAGPSVAALVPAERSDDAAEAARRHAQEGWTVVAPGFAVQGARVIVSD